MPRSRETPSRYILGETLRAGAHKQTITRSLATELAYEEDAAIE